VTTTSPRDRTDAIEIEVTPAMIAAGVAALIYVLGDEDVGVSSVQYADAVRIVYAAMTSASAQADESAPQ
jgi:hypothetical protein